MQEWKYRHDSAGVENAAVEISGGFLKRHRRGQLDKCLETTLWFRDGGSTMLRRWWNGSARSASPIRTTITRRRRRSSVLCWRYRCCWWLISVRHSTTLSLCFIIIIIYSFIKMQHKMTIKCLWMIRLGRICYRNSFVPSNVSGLWNPQSVHSDCPCATTRLVLTMYSRVFVLRSGLASRLHTRTCLHFLRIFSVQPWTARPTLAAPVVACTHGNTARKEEGQCREW